MPQSGSRGQTRALPRLLIPCLASLLLSSCAPPGEGPGPFEQTEDQVWRLVNRSHTGADGIFVQATFRTFAYEIARIYSEAEIAGLGQEQVTSRLREFVYAWIDAPYPMEDGTDINSLYLQYLVFVNPDFDVANPIQKAQFDTWRNQYVRRLLGILHDRKYPHAPPGLRRALGLRALQPAGLHHLHRRRGVRRPSLHRRHRRAHLSRRRGRGPARSERDRRGLSLRLRSA